MIEKLIKSFHLLDEEKECLRRNSIDDKDSDIFPDEFQNTNFSWKFVSEKNQTKLPAHTIICRK